MVTDQAPSALTGIWLRAARLTGMVFLVFASLAIPVAAADSLTEAIEVVTGQPHFRHAHWGALFVDRTTGDVVFAASADKLFAPVSTTKLFSVACALSELSADHRFHTPIVRRGEINPAGELDGDLILIASGDLTFGGRTLAGEMVAFADSDHTYANGGSETELTEPDPLGGLNDLARQVAAAGIRRVRGDVLIDDRLFEPARSTGSGPAYVTPIRINDNLIDFKIRPTQTGQPAQVEWRPESAAFRVESHVRTVEAGQTTTTRIHDLGEGRFYVTGQIAEGHAPVVRVQEIVDAAAFARTALIEALTRAGVRVDAPSLAPLEKSVLPETSQVRELPIVATHISPPFSEAARLILKVSHNLHASTLPLLVAQRHGERTLAAGLKRQRAFLEKAGVDVDSISFGGGAGGDPADCVTPEATVQLLQHMASRPDFGVYREALPRLGVDGTLAKNVPQTSPARDKVQAKTGTLYSGNTMNGTTLLTSKALAGYMTTASGRELTFALFVNRAHLRDGVTAKTFGDDLARICEIVYEQN